MRHLDNKRQITFYKCKSIHFKVTKISIYLISIQLLNETKYITYLIITGISIKIFSKIRNIMYNISLFRIQMVIAACINFGDRFKHINVIRSHLFILLSSVMISLS